MAGRTGAAVEQVLHAYAERGVFRALDVHGGKRGAKEFTLHWLTDVPMRLVSENGGRLLTLKNLLPNVPRRSALHDDLQRFIEERLDASLPAHRRIDARALDVAWVVARNKASLAVKVKKGDPASAARRLVNLTHELFVFLQESRAEYMWANFGTSSE
jgi:hypothetical protein